MFFEKLQIVLDEKKMTLNKLAKEAGIAQPTTIRWKNGSVPNADALIKICKYLNVSADYLLGLDKTPPPILTDQEQILLEHFRQCDKGTQKSICMLADTGAAENQEKETSLNLEKIG